MRQIIALKALDVKVPAFTPSDEKSKAMQSETEKAEKSKENQGTQETEEEPSPVDTFCVSPEDLQLLKDFQAKSIAAEEFEKDNDANFHIDFIYSWAGCRCQNYNLPVMDFLQTKLKAGRIIPALATTTAAIAGL